MPESRTLFGPSLKTDLVKVERVIAEFRAGRPVLFRDGERLALALDGAATGGVTQLFTGDCLFPGGIGKTWQPGDFERLLGDVSRKVFDRFGDDTVVYPGHGDDTVLGVERPHLAEWRERGW